MKARRGMSGEETVGALTLMGQEIPVVTRFVEHTKLKFYGENPRIYSGLRVDDRIPTQDAIQRRLGAMDHVKDLVHDIKRNGGLMDPLIVLDRTFEVLEGNSRLAAYRLLSKNNPMTWGLVKCTILPGDLDESLIFCLLGQYHIKGKKDWAPYEKAGFLHRRFKKHGLDVKTLATEIGETSQRVRQLIETYELMIESKDRNSARWSHYEEFVRSKKIRRARGEYPGFQQGMIEKIKSGKIRAVDVRDKLPTICGGSKAVIEEFVSGKLDLDAAYEHAAEQGNDNVAHDRLNKFRLWIMAKETEQLLFASSGEPRAKIEFEVDKIQKRLRALFVKLTQKK